MNNRKPSKRIVMNSVQMLLEDAMRDDAKSEHAQRDNWRLSHAATIAHWFGIEVKREG